MGCREVHLKAGPGLMDLKTNSLPARILICCIQQEKNRTIKKPAAKSDGRKQQRRF